MIDGETCTAKLVLFIRFVMFTSKLVYHDFWNQGLHYSPVSEEGEYNVPDCRTDSSLSVMQIYSLKASADDADNGDNNDYHFWEVYESE